jgi:hypothetical protein
MSPFFSALFAAAYMGAVFLIFSRVGKHWHAAR